MTLYELLGVAENASAKDIQRAYRKLAFKCHPDVSKEKGAKERFLQIDEAYKVLSDDMKRVAYDHALVVQRCIARPGESLFWSGGTTNASGFSFTVSFTRRD